MSSPRESPGSLWVFIAYAWTGFILFSSSSFALRQCNAAFQKLCSWILSGGSYQPDGTTYETMRLIADKSFHITMFFVLALPLSKVFLARQSKFGYIALTGLIVGSVSELLQNYFPGRDPAVQDVLLNLAGVVIGAGWFLRNQ
jgi:VanZ family protein